MWCRVHRAEQFAAGFLHYASSSDAESWETGSPPPGSVTPPRSGLSSPLQEPLLPYTPAPPSYEQALQHHYPSYMDHPPPPYFSVLKSDPSLYPSHHSHSSTLIVI